MLASRQTIRYLTLQRTALKQAGCKRIYEEKVSGAKRDRPALTRMLDQLREGDVVVVARLDRLAGPIRHPVAIPEVREEGGARRPPRPGAPPPQGPVIGAPARPRRGAAP